MIETKTLPFELHETNHGIDGWDATTKLVARFSSKEIARAWLSARGFTHVEPWGAYAHINPARRHTMGRLDYEIKNALIVPEDPI